MLNSLHPTSTPEITRLSESTRNLAKRYLDGEFKNTVIKSNFRLNCEENPSMTDNMKYALTVKLIAQNAPLRIMREEHLVGAATYLEAAGHSTPGCDYPSTSHVTIGFGKVLKEGYKGLRTRISKRQKAGNLSPSQQDLLEAMLTCLDAAEIWNKRQIAELCRLAENASGKIKDHYKNQAETLSRVPENPPKSFREAVQSLWSMFSFQRLCGNWSGLGRMDQMLGPYLKQDLQNGRITLEEARELLAHFWIKGTEWRNVRDIESGDAQHYQNVILGGIDRNGNQVNNEVTELILDVVEELHISDYPVAVRVSQETSDHLFRRIAEIQRLGGGIVSIYNEPLVIQALTDFGIPIHDAMEFTNDGCWEAIIGGKSAFTYLPFDALLLLQNTLQFESDTINIYPSFEALYQNFLEELKALCKESDKHAAGHFKNEQRYGNGHCIPTPLLSMFVDDCIDRALSYNDRGAKYTIAAIHAGGLPDVANSLYVIKKVVYDEKIISLDKFIEILCNNWKGAEELRQQIVHDYPLYGNDTPEVDELFTRLVNNYAEIVGEVREINGVLRPAGISTFGREIAYAPHRKATAFGRHAGEILATNLAPTPGSDINGPTAVVKSFCRPDFSRMPNGCPLELKLHPSSVSGNDGLDALTGILKAFLALGGFYLQIDTVDTEVLRDAQAHPEKYPNLSVRISGWSARFDSLSEPWQNMIINRTQQKI